MFLNSELLKEPKASLIITYKNLGKYIKDCVSSILSQSYKNFEIIIVNDNSDEKNSKILSEFKDEKIKIINLDKNFGQLCAFLEGVKVAKGEFICMIDADDVLLTNYLETLIKIHLENNVALVSASCGEINENNEITSLNYIGNHFKDVCDTLKIEKVKAAFGVWSWNPSTSGCFRKEALEILNYFPDKNYWMTGADKVIFSLLDLIGGSINVSEVCYMYRKHRQNHSTNSKTIGNKKIHNENYTKTLIEWNKKLKIDTIKMFIKNKNELIQKYNKINYIKMFLYLNFYIDKNLCAKAISALAHKLIK